MPEKTNDVIEINGHPLTLKTNKRAKRIILRTGSSGIILVMPSARHRRQAIEFARARSDWINQHAQQTTDDPLAIGSWSLQRHQSGFAVEIDEINQAIWYNTDKSTRSAIDTLRAFAHKELEPILDRELTKQGYQDLFAKFSTHNFRSKWGSCSTTGHIKLGAKLAFLPPELCDYVITHEVAHLAHPHHGRAFWQQVERHQPAYKILRKQLHKHQPHIQLSR